MATTAPLGGEGLRSWWRHEQQSVALALSAAAHHSFDKVAAGVTHDGLRAQKTDRAGEAAHRAPQRQRTRAAGEAVIFELFDEDTAGLRPGVLAEPRPQERVQRHTMEHIVDFVCCAPMVQILDAPVPQTLEQLPDVLQFFGTLMTDSEQVIEVPKILPEDVPMRAALRDPQLAEQLVEVPTIISNPLLSLLQALLEHKQRTAEQNVDIPAVGGIGTVEVGSRMVWVEVGWRRWWRWRESGAVLGQVSTLASGVRMDPHELLDKVADMPVVVPQPQFVDKVFAIPVVMQRQIPMKSTVQLTMQIPQL